MSDDPDEWLFKPIESTVARHHVVTMEAIQRCIEADSGRLMIFEPPGSAKSTYASVVGTSWAMGRLPGYKVILTSYAATPAERQSKRCRAIAGSPEFVSIWPEPVAIRAGSSSVSEWELTNDSSLLAAGILGAVTSARADLLLIDDPVAGREEADSETMRRKTRQAYDDDLMTRLKPRASVIIIQTRWHQDDLAGGILPEDYTGQSGPVLCRDGQVWEVLNIPAKAEHPDDPVGRALGEYLWPEWFDARHWANYESNPRTWSSLYQQRPTPDTGGQFEREWFEWYDEGDEPANLRMYGASDYAVTKKAMDTHPDFTEHGIVGVADDGHWWFRDWWSGQDAPDKTIAAFCSLVRQWKPVQWFDEGGTLRRALEPLKNKMMTEANAHVHVEYLTSATDKIARIASFRGRASARKVHLPRKPWAYRLADQLCAFPMGRYDDAADVCGNIGRGLDEMTNASKPEAPKKQPPKPFTGDWFDAKDRELIPDESENKGYYA
jgi:predicted phage terminase large subunit-like protein